MLSWTLSTLRLFIPPQVCKMTPILRQICGCEICIISKYVQIDLNIFRTNIVSYFQQIYVGRHIRNSPFSTKSYVNYKEKVVPYGEFLHANTKDASQCIACTLIKPKNIIHMKCDLGFLINALSISFLIKNSMMDQMLHWYILVFIPINYNVQNMV